MHSRSLLQKCPSAALPIRQTTSVVRPKGLEGAVFLARYVHNLCYSARLPTDRGDCRVVACASSSLYHAASKLNLPRASTGGQLFRLYGVSPLERWSSAVDGSSIHVSAYPQYQYPLPDCNLLPRVLCASHTPIPNSSHNRLRVLLYGRYISFGQGSNNARASLTFKLSTILYQSFSH